MRLNKIEIKGFKSFGDKTTINFNSGVTGIVGQTGGKSNIVDAIRWVLGEQKPACLDRIKWKMLYLMGVSQEKNFN